MWEKLQQKPELLHNPPEEIHEDYVAIDEGLLDWSWTADYIGYALEKWEMFDTSRRVESYITKIIEKLIDGWIWHDMLKWVLVINDYCIIHYYDSHGNIHEMVFQKWYRQETDDLIWAVGIVRKDIPVIQEKQEVFTEVTLTLGEIKLQEKEAKEQRIEESSQQLRVLESVLKSMEQIFQKNKREWTDKIGDEDSVNINISEFPWSEIPQVQWKKSLHLTDLQTVAQSIIWDLQQQDLDSDMQKLLWNYEEQYLDYIVWIWDMYEWGARAFHGEVQQTQIDQLIADLVERKSVPELLQYMLVKHASIEANNYQSTEVQRTYGYWSHSLNKAVLHKMKNEDVDTEFFHQYARIVSGRDVPELSKKIWKQRNLSWGDNKVVRSSHSLDGNLFDPESASEALLYVFERPGWVFEKLEKEKGFSIIDPLSEKISDNEKNPKAVIQKCSKLIQQKVEWFHESYNWESLLKKAGFGNMFDNSLPYNELSLSQKMQMWIIWRLIKKLEDIQNPSQYSTRYRSKHKWHREWWNDEWKISYERFWELFLKVWEEWQEAIIIEINQELDGWWFGDKNDISTLSLWEQELYNLYNDMWGNDGIFDISDMNIETFKAIGQFWAILIGSIWLAIALWAAFPILASSWVYFMTTAALSSVAVSRIVIPEWYDTNKDMMLDIITDSIVAVMFWVAWWKMTQASYAQFMADSWKWMSWDGLKHMGYNAIDIGILWIWTELLRNYVLRTENIQVHKNLPKVHNTAAIDARDRFSKEDFHNYVRMNLEPYIERK